MASFASNRGRLDELLKELKNTKDELKGGELIKSLALDVEKPKVRKILKGHNSKVTCLHWSVINPAQLLTSGQDGFLVVWDALSGHRIHAIPLGSSSLWVMTCAFSPSNSFVACAGLDNTCSIFNLQTKDIKACRALKGHSAGINSCRFVTDKQILTASGDKKCILHNLDTGQKAREFTEHTSDVCCLALPHTATETTRFLSGAIGGQTKLWDIRQQQSVFTWGFDSDVNTVAFLRNGLGFAVGCEDGAAHFMDIRSGRQVQVFGPVQPTGNVDMEDTGVTALDFSQSGRFLFTGLDNNICRTWDTLTGAEVWVLDGHEGRVSCVGVNSDGTAIATCSFDSTTRVWA